MPASEREYMREFQESSPETGHERPLREYHQTFAGYREYDPDRPRSYGWVWLLVIAWIIGKFLG